MGIVLLGLTIPLSFYLSFYWLRHVRMIEDVPTAKIRSGAQGYVELEAIARERDGFVLRSPVSGRKCLWWSVIIEKRIPFPGFWKWIEKRQSSGFFYIEDETGLCLVDPEGAIAEMMATERQFYGDTPDPECSHRKGKQYSEGQYRYSEAIIEPDTPLHLLGQFVNRVNMDAGARERMYGNFGEEIPDHLPMLCKPPHKHQTFLISVDSQRSLCRRLRIASAIAIVWSFGAAITIGLFMLRT